MTEKKIDIIGRVVDHVFSLKKRTICLIFIIFLAFLLRIIAAVNLSVSADDMHFVTHAINFLSSGRLITYDQSSGLWFAFTGIMYNLFGATQVSSRIAAILFGSFSTLAIYLLAREFFDEKTSLISAFLLAIAPFHIKLTIAEMDVMAMFFVISGMFIFIKALKSDKSRYFAISGTFIGLAIYTKVYPLLFIPSLLLYFVYFNRKYKKPILTNNNVRKILVFLLAIFIFTVPALTHNYLLYKDKGFLDLQFTRTLGLGKDISGQYYSWDAQFNANNSWRGLFFGDTKHVASGTPLLIAAIDYIRIGDPTAFYLGLIGLIIIIFTRGKIKDYFMFFVLSVIFILPFLASIILLPKHYVFLELLLITPAAHLISNVTNKFSHLKFRPEKLVLIALLLFSLFYLGLPNTGTNSHFYGQSHIGQIMDFKEAIPETSLIVADSRIYRGRIHWFSHGKFYLEGSNFIEAIKIQDEMPGRTVSADVYFIECVIDDCGWGGISDQPEFNASMEGLVELFSRNGRLVDEISEPDRFSAYFPLSDNKLEVIKIYHAELPIKEQILLIASQPKEWFLYPIGYEPRESNFDYYQARNFFDIVLDKLAHAIVWIALILSLIAIVYLIYQTKNEAVNNNSFL